MKKIAVLMAGLKDRQFAVVAEPFTIKKMPWLKLCVHPSLDRYDLFNVSEITTGTAVPGLWRTPKEAKKMSTILILHQGEKKVRAMIKKSRK